MLKKKILGAKVLDTNGYVLATRLIVPTNSEKDKAEIQLLFNLGTSDPAHQLGDIYNANMVDVVAKAVSLGDAQLDQQINEEAAARTTADNALSNRIDLEVSDRKQAITDLINGAPEAYDTLKEISDYISEDKDAGAALVNALSTETSERKEADDTEYARAKAAETALLDAIDSLNADETSEGSVAYAIAQETTARKAADAEILDSIKTTNSDITLEVQDRKDAVNSLLKLMIVALLSSTYDKDTNMLTLVFVKGDNSTITYTTNLGDIIDSNDLVSSSTTTAQYVDGKLYVNVNAMTTDDVNNIINKTE